MPANFNYTTGQTRVECSRCHGYVAFEGRHLTGTETVLSSAAGANPDTGESRGMAQHGSDVRDWIRFLNRGRYHSWCRTCERETRRAASAANPNRQTRRRAPRLTNGEPRRFSERKFGVELELIFPGRIGREEISSQLAAAGLTGWRVKSDGSLRGHGLEVVSPILQGEAGMDQVQIACRVLNRLGAKPNSSCGLHVHHDIADLDIDALKRVAHAWAGNQNLIDGLVSPSRRNGYYYAQPFTPSDLRTIDNAVALADARRLGIARYKAMNFAAYARYGTVEIRQHQGTCSFEKIRTWILFGQALIDTAKATPVPATTRVRDLVARLTAVLDETAKTYLLGRALEFGHAAV